MPASRLPDRNKKVSKTRYAWLSPDAGSPDAVLNCQIQDFFRMLQRLRAFAQTTTYLGVLVIAGIWGGVSFLTHEQHQRAYAEGARQGSNLTYVFEQYIARVIGGADSGL